MHQVMNGEEAEPPEKACASGEVAVEGRAGYGRACAVPSARARAGVMSASAAAVDSWLYAGAVYLLLLMLSTMPENGRLYSMFVYHCTQQHR